jgi:hypothetical protein
VGVLNVTTYEKKNGFLLIEIFKTLFNPQNYAHQSSILGGLFYLRQLVKKSPTLRRGGKEQGKFSVPLKEGKSKAAELFN